MSDRATLSLEFLRRAGWASAAREFLAGDASDRRYERLTMGAATAVLMDSPPGQGDDPAAFLKIAAHLRATGLSAPECLAEDLQSGFLLLEDFGDGVYARLLARGEGNELVYYLAATDALLALQRQPPAKGLSNLSAREWADAASLALEWYRFAITGDRADEGLFRAVLSDALGKRADGARVMILRDYHAENLIWLAKRPGVARVGLLDFQLAQLGQPGYDLVSLLQDARRDVAPETEAASIRHFLEGSGMAEQDFRPSYAALGAQRALRILGIFARLCLQEGKPGYVKLIPRVWQHLWRNLETAELVELAAVCKKLLPPPNPDALDKIGAQCGRFR